MADESAVAAPPAATVIQFDGWDEDGEPVQSAAAKAAAAAEKPAKPAESAPAAHGAKPGEEADADASPAPKKPQESAGSGKSKTEKRFQELLQERNDLKRRLEAAEKPPAATTKPGEEKPGDQTLKPQVQNYADWRKEFKPAKWIERYGADHPGATYEDAYAAMADYQYEVRRNFEQVDQARTTALQQVAEVRKQAAERYPDFEEVALPVADKVLALVQDPKVDGVLKRAIMDPDGFHILYALGKDEAVATKFEKLAREDPAEAIFLWKTLKADVRKELARPAGEKKPVAANGEAEIPAQPKPRAPKPPSEVGGRGAVGEDALVSAAKTGDFRTFEAEQTRRALASRSSR